MKSTKPKPGKTYKSKLGWTYTPFEELLIRRVCESARKFMEKYGTGRR